MRYAFDRVPASESWRTSSLAEIAKQVTSAPPRAQLSPRALDHLAPAAGPWADAARTLGRQAARWFKPVLKGQQARWQPGYQRGARIARQLIGREYATSPFCQRRMTPGTDAAVALALDGSGSMWRYAGQPEQHPQGKWPSTYPAQWEDTRFGQAKLLAQSLAYGLTEAGAQVGVFTQRKAHSHSQTKLDSMREQNQLVPSFADALPREQWNVLHDTHRSTEAVTIKGFDSPYNPRDFAYYTAGACADSGAHYTAAYNALLNRKARTRILFVLADGGCTGGDNVGISYTQLALQGMRDGVAVILLSMADSSAIRHVPQHLRAFYHLVRAEDTADATAEAARMLSKALIHARPR